MSENMVSTVTTLFALTGTANCFHDRPDSQNKVAQIKKTKPASELPERMKLKKSQANQWGTSEKNILSVHHLDKMGGALHRDAAPGRLLREASCQF